MAGVGGVRVGAGRKKGVPNKRTRETAARALASGLAPLDVMLDNMRHFQQVALDAEAVLQGLTAAEFSTQVASDASAEEQFKFLLAQVKKTVGFRQAAQDAARDAAPYIHAKLSAITVGGDDAKPIKHEVTVRYVDR